MLAVRNLKGNAALARIVAQTKGPKPDVTLQDWTLARCRRCEQPKNSPASRSRSDPPLMRSVTEHQRVVADMIRARPPIAVPLTEAQGLVLSDDVIAQLSLPVFDNSAMDGYAVRAEDISSATRNTPWCCRSPRTFRPGAPTN